MPVQRELAAAVRADAEKHPIVTVVGPRQSGKTTLARSCFPDVPYANLEEPDTRRFAIEDARGFLSQYPRGGIIDEIQRVPQLSSYLQADVDLKDQSGRWILTGSHQPELRQSISQSLAGRTALATLLPFTLAELAEIERAYRLDDLLVAGFYPRLHDALISPHRFHSDYVATYLERDVRQLINLRDIDTFQRFVVLAAGRAANLLNHAALGAEVGVHQTTIREWLSTLQASFVATTLSPWFINIGKRLVKTPKLYWYDVGLVSHLLGITDTAHLRGHPHRGALFENLVVAEALKVIFHSASACRAHFYRDSHGHEVDLVLEVGGKTLAVEIKAGMTVASDWLTALEHFKAIPEARVDHCLIVYAGDREQQRSGVTVCPWWRFPVHLLEWLEKMRALPHQRNVSALETRLACVYGSG